MEALHPEKKVVEQFNHKWNNLFPPDILRYCEFSASVFSPKKIFLYLSVSSLCVYYIIFSRQLLTQFLFYSFRHISCFSHPLNPSAMHDIVTLFWGSKIRVITFSRNIKKCPRASSLMMEKSRVTHLKSRRKILFFFFWWKVRKLVQNEVFLPLELFLSCNCCRGSMSENGIVWKNIGGKTLFIILSNYLLGKLLIDFK